MPCRVGITTDEERRRAEWEKEVVGLHNWQIHARGLSREDAQALEKEIAEANNCNYHAGGAPPDDSGATWSVYSFSYTRTC